MEGTANGVESLHMPDPAEEVEGKEWPELCEAHGNPGRDLALMLGLRHAGLSLKELAERTGKMEYPAVWDAVRRMKEGIEQDNLLKKKAGQLAKILNLEM